MLSNKVFIVSVEEREHSGKNVYSNRYTYKVCETLDNALTHIDHFENENNKRVELTYSNQLRKYVGQCVKDSKTVRVGNRMVDEPGYVTEYYVSVEEYPVSGPRKPSHASMI